MLQQSAQFTARAHVTRFANHSTWRTNLNNFGPVLGFKCCHTCKVDCRLISPSESLDSARNIKIGLEQRSTPGSSRCSLIETMEHRRKGTTSEAVMSSDARTVYFKKMTAIEGGNLGKAWVHNPINPSIVAHRRIRSERGKEVEFC